VGVLRFDETGKFLEKNTIVSRKPLNSEEIKDVMGQQLSREALAAQNAATENYGEEDSGRPVEEFGYEAHDHARNERLASFQDGAENAATNKGGDNDFESDTQQSAVSVNKNRVPSADDKSSKKTAATTRSKENSKKEGFHFPEFTLPKFLQKKKDVPAQKIGRTDGRIAYPEAGRFASEQSNRRIDIPLVDAGEITLHSGATAQVSHGELTPEALKYLGGLDPEGLKKVGLTRISEKSGLLNLTKNGVVVDKVKVPLEVRYARCTAIEEKVKLIYFMVPTKIMETGGTNQNTVGTPL